MATGSIARVGVIRDVQGTLKGPTETSSPIGAVASANLFELLGIRPLIGRFFSADEDLTTASDVMVLSFDLWARSFNADSGIIGKVVSFNDRSYRVIGVLPRDALLGRPLVDTEDEPAAFFVPLGSVDARAGTSRSFFSILARVERSSSAIELQARLAGVVARASSTTTGSDDSGVKWRVNVRGMQAAYADAYGSTYRYFLGAVGFLLLITCANVSGLFMTRVASQRHEVAVRHALGASRRQLAEPFAIEIAILCVCAAIVSLFVGGLGSRLASILPPQSRPYWTTAALDWRVVAYTVAVVIGSGFAVAVGPLIAAARANPALPNDRGSRLSSSRRGTALRRLLIVAQLALTLVLLTGASLLTKTFVETSRRDPGIATKNVIRGFLDARQSGAALPEQQRELATTLLEQLHNIPGVQSAALSGRPVKRFGGSFVRDDVTSTSHSGSPSTINEAVSPDYFRTLGIPVKHGRVFSVVDGEESEPVAILDEETAFHVFGSTAAVGKRFRFSGPDGESPWMRVVGVVGSVNGVVVKTATTYRPMIYVPISQAPALALTFAVSTRGPSPSVVRAIRRSLHDFFPSLPLVTIATIEQLRERQLAPIRFNAIIVGSFAVIALMVSVVGAYGLVSYSMAVASSELAIRVAIGATRGQILIVALRPALVMIACALLVGVGGSFALTRILGSILYETSPTDLGALIVASAILGLVTLLAAFIPGWRATRVNPVDVLRRV